MDPAEGMPAVSVGAVPIDSRVRSEPPNGGGACFTRAPRSLVYLLMAGVGLLTLTSCPGRDRLVPGDPLGDASPGVDLVGDAVLGDTVADAGPAIAPDTPCGAYGDSYIFTLAWSPDGTTIAGTVGQIGVRIFRASDGEVVTSFPTKHTDEVTSLAFSPDGAVLASGANDGTICLWRVGDWSELKTLARHTGAVDLAFSPNGTWLASGGRDGAIKIMQASDGAVLLTIDGHVGGVSAVRFSPDSTLLVSGGADNMVRAWRVTDGSAQGAFAGHSAEVEAVDVSPDGTLVASGGRDGTVRLWRLDDGSPQATLVTQTTAVHSLAFSPDGKVVALGGGYDSDDGSERVKLADVSGGAVRSLGGHLRPVTAVAFSKDGTRLATSSYGTTGTLRLWCLP